MGTDGEKHALNNDHITGTSGTTSGANRTGRTGLKVRTIVAKFANYKEHELVLAAAKKKRPRRVYVNEDFTENHGET